MAIGRISGSVLKSNLTRNGVDLAFETNLLYLDVTNSRVGIGTSEPSTELDVSGTITATTLAGSTATLTNTTTGDSLLITTTEDSSTAAPVITLKRNSSSPADADYLGQLKFKGENDADQEVVYAKITGKIADASDTTEDGIIEFANRKAGSNTITARLRSDSFQLLNDTNLVVRGLTYPTADGTAGQVIQTDGSGNLSFATISIGDLSIVGSTISSPSNADLTLTTGGTGTVVINGIGFPTGDGSANQVLATNGSGQLSFVNSGTASTDTDEAGAGDGTTDIAGSQSVINSFNISTYDAAFYYVVSRDEVNQELDMKRHSLTHNDSAAVVNSFHVVESDENNSYLTVDADVNSNLARLIATGQSVSNSVSLYRVVLGPSTTASSDGNTAFIVNTDVDSAVENLDTWSASTYRGAHYQINATNTAKTESTNIEALVVTDGTSAFITTFGETSTGNNPLISLTADVSGGDVRLRVGGNEPNLRVVAYRVLLGDSESDSTGSSVNVVGATTVSSSATALDSMSSDDYNAAWYVVVGHNSTEGASSIQLVNMLNDGTDAFVSQGPYVSSKGTSQLSFTGTFSGGTATLNCASTSGGSTTVNAYRVHLKRGAANTVTTNTQQTISGSKTFTSAILADTIRSPGSNADILLDPQGTGGVKVGSLSTTNAFLINGGDGEISETTTLTVDPASNYLGINQTSPEVTLHMTGEGNQSTQIRMEQHNNGGDAPDIRTRKSRGTADSPSDNNAGDFLFRINAEAYQTNTYNTMGSIQIDLDDSDNTASTFQIQTHDGTSLADRLTINGSGNATFSGSVTGKGFTEEINALTSSSTITVNCDLARVHTVTLGTDTEFNITNLPTGGTVTLIITQDGTGSRTATFGTSGSTAVRFPSGSSVLSTGANDIDVVSIFNDGTNFLGNIARNYS